MLAVFFSDVLCILSINTCWLTNRPNKTSCFVWCRVNCAKSWQLFYSSAKLVVVIPAHVCAVLISCSQQKDSFSGLSNRLCNIYEFEDMAAELYVHAGMLRPSLSIIEEGCNSHMYDYEANTT